MAADFRLGRVFVRDNFLRRGGRILTKFGRLKASYGINSLQAGVLTAVEVLPTASKI